MTTDEQQATTDPFPWRYWPPYGASEVREMRFATQAQALAHCTSAVYAPRDGAARG